MTKELTDAEYQEAIDKLVEAAECTLGWEDKMREHKKLAEKKLEKITEYGYEVLEKKMKGDGWMDGWRCVHATIRDKRTDEVHNIHWHDANKEFFYATRTGSWPLRSEDGFEFVKRL